MGVIRLLLALSVVITHSEEVIYVNLVGGRVAVQSFYIISGFYMALILHEKYIGKNASYKLFITNRLLRLYPIYCTILLLTISISIAIFIYTKGYEIGMLQPYFDYFNQMSISTILFLIFSNTLILCQDLVMFLGLELSSGNLFFTENFRNSSPPLFIFLLIPQAWTISIEILFYLIAPFIIKRKLIVILILILLSAFLRLLLYENNLSHDPWSYRFFPSELLFFLLGALSYKGGYQKLKYSTTSYYLLYAIYTLILMMTLLYSFLSFPFKDILYFTLLFLSLPFIFSLTKSQKIDRFIGELSYPVYLSHMLVLFIYNEVNIEWQGAKIPIVLVATILLSVALNELIAKKVEDLRQKRVKHN